MKGKEEIGEERKTKGKGQKGKDAEREGGRK